MGRREGGAEGEAEGRNCSSHNNAHPLRAPSPLPPPNCSKGLAGLGSRPPHASESIAPPPGVQRAAEQGEGLRNVYLAWRALSSAPHAIHQSNAKSFQVALHGMLTGRTDTCCWKACSRRLHSIPRLILSICSGNRSKLRIGQFAKTGSDISADLYSSHSWTK